MKKLFIRCLAVLAAFCALGCTSQGVRITVSNPGSQDRASETVSACFECLTRALPDLTKDNCTLIDSDGKQVPCQIVDHRLYWRASVPGGKKARYTVKTGTPEVFETRAYSRHVPERFDDFAWENDLIAGRIYGPALNTPRTLGSDIWVKCTPRLVIDEWFAKDDYHHNHGEGMDCYKVANTLGGGALAPVWGKKVVIGDNWQTLEHVCDGPVMSRTTLTYSFPVGEMEASLKREFTVEAGSRFVKNVMTYDAPCDSLDVILGAMDHGVKYLESGCHWVAFCEAASDYTKDPELDGDIYVALVMDPAVKCRFKRIGSHVGLVTRIASGKPVTVWTASGWSQGGVESPKAWTEYVQAFRDAVCSPLKVELK